MTEIKISDEAREFAKTIARLELEAHQAGLNFHHATVASDIAQEAQLLLNARDAEIESLRKEKLEISMLAKTRIAVAEAHLENIRTVNQELRDNAKRSEAELAELRRDKDECLAWLDSQTITSDNIGEIRRSCFMPFDGHWNSFVRDETANRENAAMSGKEKGEK